MGLLQNLDIDEFFLIDPYEEYNECKEVKSNANKMTDAQKEAHERLDGYSNLSWIEKYSDKAISEINRELDYVYIDGNHHHEYVKRYIENYYPLLKVNEILAGDDVNWMGVSRAVMEFAYRKELQPHFEPKHEDWFFVKGRNIDAKKPLPYTVEADLTENQRHSL